MCKFQLTLTSRAMPHNLIEGCDMPQLNCKRASEILLIQKPLHEIYAEKKEHFGLNYHLEETSAQTNSLNVTRSPNMRVSAVTLSKEIT